MAHQVIIGDGATAAAFAASARLCDGDALTILGPNAGRLGRGLAYVDHPVSAPWRYAYLLNSPSGAFGQAFADWLGANWADVEARIAAHQPRWLADNAGHLNARDLAATFAPRAVFGDHLVEAAREALARHAANGVRVERRTGLATDLSKDQNGFRITLATGEAIRADRVDLAAGGPSPQRFGADAGPTAFTTLYGAEDAIAAVLRPGREVTCLGGNAAMLDVLRFLQSVLDEPDIRLRVISRGAEPEPLIWTRPRTRPVAPQIAGVFDTADALLAAVDAEIAHLRTQGARVAELRPGYLEWARNADLAAMLPTAAERRRLMPQLERRFRRGTYDSLADYVRLRAAGRIVEEKAEVESVFAMEEGAVRIRFWPVGGGPAKEIATSLVINASGTGAQFATDILTSGLIRNGWLRMNASRTGLIVGPGLEAEIAGLRYLSPAVTEIGDEILAFPLYDVVALTERATAANQFRNLNGAP